MSPIEYDAAVAAFISSRGVTRCPTVCLAPTQGSISITDQIALQQRAEELEGLRQERLRNQGYLERST
jgi:hypothetical protein